MLLELERIVLDRSHPLAARIMAARTALPFMLPKRLEPNNNGVDHDKLIGRIQEGRKRAELAHKRNLSEAMPPLRLAGSPW